MKKCDNCDLNGKCGVYDKCKWYNNLEDFFKPKEITKEEALERVMCLRDNYLGKNDYVKKSLAKVRSYIERT